MGTYQDSKIQRAAKAFQCVACKGQIKAGDEYLRYALGQRWRVPVHIDCARKPHSGYDNCAAIQGRS